MTVNVYCLQNTLTGLYGEMFAFPTDAFAVSRVGKTLKQDGVDYTTENNLIRLATLDIETAELTPTGVNLIPWAATSPAIAP